MFGESWKRPSLVLAIWIALLLAVFVWRGDLRIQLAATAQPPAAAPAADGPVIVKAQRPAGERPAVAEQRTARVFDAAGFLVVGAEVTIAGRATSRTDADGQFVLQLVDGEPAYVLVRAASCQPSWLRASASSPDVLAVQLVPAAPWDEQPAAPPGPQCVGEGLVRSTGGEPVAGAYVTAAGSGLWSRTDEIGRYRLPLCSNEVTLIVHGPAVSEGGGVAARSEPIALPRAQGVVPLPQLVAEPAGAIRGVVRDGRGVPVVGVPVQLRGEGIVRVAETGPGGRFGVSGLQAGSYTVRPFSFRGSLGAPVAVALDHRVVECDLHLQSAEERRLLILDERGAPVPHAYVAPTLSGERTSVGCADVDGWAAVRVGVGEAAGAWEFEVRRGADHAPAAVRSFDAASATLVVALP